MNEVCCTLLLEEVGDRMPLEIHKSEHVRPWFTIIPSYLTEPKEPLGDSGRSGEWMRSMCGVYHKLGQAEGEPTPYCSVGHIVYECNGQNPDP